MLRHYQSLASAWRFELVPTQANVVAKPRLDFNEWVWAVDFDFGVWAVHFHEWVWAVYFYERAVVRC
eukprot:4200801-Heterocapsa_arctica.AAC.1